MLSTYIADDNTIWTGTEGSGLYHYNRTTKQSVAYDLSDGLPNEFIYAIVPDGNNHLWLSTNSGLSRFHLISKQFKKFDASYGIAGNEFNYGASLKSKQGNLFLVALTGLFSLILKILSKTILFHQYLSSRSWSETFKNQILK